jgi:hypothetical protein
MAKWFGKLFGGGGEPPRVATDTSANGVYSGLRHQALTTKRDAAGIPAPPADAPVWGILMESGFPNATATLLALADGTTSLYLSSGGGVIGGQGHAQVLAANAVFLRAANLLRQQLEPTQSFPIPENGHAIFYALTDAGVLTGGGPESELGPGQHKLSALFHAGHGVITQLRLLSEARGSGA